MDKSFHRINLHVGLPAFLDFKDWIFHWKYSWVLLLVTSDHLHNTIWQTKQPKHQINCWITRSCCYVTELTS